MPNTPNEPPSTDDELSEAIAKLTEAATKGPREDRPDRLPIGDIIECPEAFNVRGEDPLEYHLTELKRALERMADLDPVLILPCGDSFVLIDGHHRLEAYRRDEERTDIPVRYFEGSIENAVLEAARINAKAVLPLNNQQRQNLAWRLDLTGRYTKPQVMEAAGVSNGQIAIMRRAKRKLGSQASEFDTWWKAKRAADGNPNSWTEQEDIDAWRQHRAQVIADKLAKTFGPKLSGNPSIAALALEIHFGRKLADLTQELIDICQDELEEDDEDTDF